MRKTESTTRIWAAQLARVVLVVLLAGAANAATFSVASQGSNLSWQTGVTVLPILGNTPTYGGLPTFKWRPEGYPTIMGTGSNPVRLTIGPGLIDKTLPYPVRIPTAYPGIPQFTTQLNMYAPKAGSTAMFGPGATGKTWPATFSWCPKGTVGADANPSCATVLPGGTSPTQGTISGIVKYTPGTSGPRFGGTMGMFTSGRFSWFEVVPPTTPTYKLKLNNPPGTTPPNPSAAAGAGYSNYVYNGAGPGDPLYSFASAGAVPRVTTYYGGMVITNPHITSPTDNKTLIPGGTSMSWGFPFTTGTVYIKVPASNPGPFLTVTGVGSDNRTPLGIGNITMVAAGMIHGDGPGGTVTLPQIFRITLNVPEPSRVLMLGSGVALLGLVAVARRRTSARAE